MKKIVVTGMGAVTPVGIGVENYWNNITAGASGIDTIKTFDPSELAVQIAGEVKNFNPSDYLPKDLIRKTDPFMQYAYIAAEEAMKQSGIKIEPERTGIVMGTAMAGIATIAYTQEARTASRPFDVTRDGFVIGEGGGALVLETEEHALARGAKIYAEIRGCGNTDDAYHVTAPHPEGRGAIACMKQAIAEAGINPSDIGYINAHGTATNKGDTVETSSIKKVFGNTLPYVSSTKGATGHMMGAGGITETITCVKAIETGTVPPTINLNEVDPECAGIDFVANTAKKAEINFAMSNAFGFGGQNSSIIVGKYGK